MHNDVELDGWVILGFSDYFLVALEDTPAAWLPVAGAAFSIVRNRARAYLGGGSLGGLTLGVFNRFYNILS